MPAPQFPRLRGVGGALVREVVADSPAQKAGLKVGDVITAVDGVPLDENHRLADIVGQYQPGDQITLEVSRMGKTVTLKATLGENPDSNGQPYLGVRYTDLAPGAEPGRLKRILSICRSAPLRSPGGQAQGHAPTPDY